MDGVEVEEEEEEERNLDVVGVVSGKASLDVEEDE